MTGHLITAPLHEETRPIVTERCDGAAPPIKWCAFRDGDWVDAPCGYGTTKHEAIEELLRLERR